MGMDVGSAKGSVRSDINITPLVDVVLVLLIIFMVITPMLQRGKSVELPKARHAASSPPGPGPEPIFVSVTKTGDVYLEQDKTPVTDEGLLTALKDAALGQKRVMVKADVETEYGKVRPVLDKASKAKLKGVSLAAEELKGK
jgi:biopolymer transport protein ExbD/biopolymer transport protein TolR